MMEEMKPTVFENPRGSPSCNSLPNIYFSVIPFDPQGVHSITVLYTRSKSFFVEEPMTADGATYYGPGESINNPVTYFFRAVDGLGNVTDSHIYEFSTGCA